MTEQILLFLDINGVIYVEEDGKTPEQISKHETGYPVPGTKKFLQVTYLRQNKSSVSPRPEIKAKEKRGRGRPKASKNKNKTEVILTSELLRIKKMINELVKLIANFIPLTYLVLDGHFGNNNAKADGSTGQLVYNFQVTPRFSIIHTLPKS